MIRFNNDYNHGAYPPILAALADSNGSGFAGYGADEYCALAADEIRALARRPDAEVFFFSGATQANLVVHAAALRPTQSVISAASGHINAHEAAAIECTGHKILALPARDGKLDAEQVRACAEEYFLGGRPEYLTEPKMVYISFPTELGTLYSLRELEALSAVCREFGMYLFVDGARLGYGLAAEGCGVTLPDLARLSDVFYIGGTKCGALFGEALLVSAPELRRGFKTYMKQHGAVLAKGWLMGLQFHVLLSGGAYFDICARADRLALRLKAAFVKKGLPPAVDSITNQQFFVLTPEQETALAADFSFEPMGKTAEGLNIDRFCTSWATTEEELELLIAAIERL